MIGIYYIKNKSNGMVYIGQSIQIKTRWARHIWELNTNQHDNQYLQNAWNKYGQNNFEFGILEECPKEMLNERETYWFNKYAPNTYNLSSTGEHHYLQEESKLKISNKLKGVKKSSETIKRMREAQSKINHHRKHTPEAKEKIVNALIGRNVSVQTRNKISKANTGKQRIDILGKKRPVEVVEKYIAPKRKPVLQFDLEGNLIREWISTQEPSKKLGIPNANINRVLHGKRKQAGGYVWKYKTCLIVSQT